MSRATYLLSKLDEANAKEDNLMDDEEEDEKQAAKPGHVKVKDFIKKEKQDHEARGETEDDPDVIDPDDDDMRKSAKVAHFMDRTSGTTKEGRIKNYAFPTKRVSREDE